MGHIIKWPPWLRKSLLTCMCLISLLQNLLKPGKVLLLFFKPRIRKKREYIIQDTRATVRLLSLALWKPTAVPALGQQWSSRVPCTATASVNNTTETQILLHIWIQRKADDPEDYKQLSIPYFAISLLLSPFFSLFQLFYKKY